MELLIHGMVKASDRNGPGMILLTDSNAFFFLTDPTASAWAGGGGLIGFLIGQFIANKKAEKNPPAHLNDPEIQSLDQKLRRKLLPTILLTKAPLDGSATVQETRAGYTFTLADGREAQILSWGNKKR